MESFEGSSYWMAPEVRLLKFKTRAAAFKRYCSGATTHNIFLGIPPTYLLAHVGKIFILSFYDIN
jgi:hypothetical protein